jgi:hypothetical protein
MASRLTRALRRMTDHSAMSWWRPQGFDPLIDLPLPEAPLSQDDVVRRDGSSGDLRDRQRELAFEMYGEALLRIAAEDEAAHHRDDRATA